MTDTPDQQDPSSTQLYQPPATHVSDSSVTGVQVRTVPASNGVRWWLDAWRIFCQSPWVIIGAFLIFCILYCLSLIVPLASTLLTPMIMGGFMIGFQKLDQGQTMSIEDMFAGFKTQSGQLILVGVIQVCLAIATFIIFMILFFSSLSALSNGFAGGSFTSLLSVAGIISMLVGVLLILLNMTIYFAAWFVPCLILFNQQEPIPAFKLCLRAFIINWLPLLIYSLIMTVIFIAAAVPLLLGFVLAVPVTMITCYTVYKDMFEADTASPESIIEPTP